MVKGLEIKKQILANALIFENMTSIFLAALLDINDAKNSITLGTKNSALSFKTKIDLLIDIGALEDKTKAKFQTFMEIRNQFMHNIYAEDFTSCYSFAGKESYILKTYPQQPSINKEEQLKLATLALVDDVLSITKKLIHKLNTKIKHLAESQVHKESNDLFFESIDDVIKESLDYIKQNKDTKTSYSNDDVTKIISNVHVKILKRWQAKIVGQK